MGASWPELKLTGQRVGTEPLRQGGYQEITTWLLPLPLAEAPVPGGQEAHPAPPMAQPPAHLPRPDQHPWDLPRTEQVLGGKAEAPTLGLSLASKYNLDNNCQIIVPTNLSTNHVDETFHISPFLGGPVMPASVGGGGKPKTQRGESMCPRLHSL